MSEPTSRFSKSKLSNPNNAQSPLVKCIKARLRHLSRLILTLARSSRMRNSKTSKSSTTLIMTSPSLVLATRRAVVFKLFKRSRTALTMLRKLRTIPALKKKTTRRDPRTLTTTRSTMIAWLTTPLDSQM